MAKNKMGLLFEGFEDVIKKLNDLGAHTKEITEKALKASHEYVTPQLHTHMAKHRQTGDTERSISETANVTWKGSVAEVDIGFQIRKGGLPSIFLMYGTPKMKKDTKLYNAVYGKTTQKKIAQIQEEIFYDAVQKAMEG